MTFEYWYVFPVAIIVAILANASGFSGGVLFQPFFNFVLKVPIAQSIATGIATETIGMTSGAVRYYFMNKIDISAVKKVIPFVLAGVISGIFIFLHLPKQYLRLTVGLVIFSIASYQLYLAYFNHFGNSYLADLKALSTIPSRIKQFFAGIGSACTGTGIAEIHQPLFEQQGNLETKRANASAIVIEALGDWLITLINLKLGNINFDILIFSVSGTLIGAQIGALLSPYLPDRLLKIIFGFSVCFIGIVYIVTSLQKIIFS
jgi:hypothetical protein